MRRIQKFILCSSKIIVLICLRNKFTNWRAWTKGSYVKLQKKVRTFESIWWETDISRGKVITE